MYRSKNCGHGLNLYFKTKVITQSMLMPNNLRDETGIVYLEFNPVYCPLCGKKVEAENGN